MLKYRSHSTDVMGSNAAMVSSLCVMGQLLRKKRFDNADHKNGAGASKGQWLRTYDLYRWNSSMYPSLSGSIRKKVERSISKLSSPNSMRAASDRIIECGNRHSNAPTTLAASSGNRARIPHSRPLRRRHYTTHALKPMMRRSFSSADTSSLRYSLVKDRKFVDIAGFSRSVLANASSVAHVAVMC